MGKGTKVVAHEGTDTRWVFFTNAGMGKGTVVPYPLGTHCHPYIWQVYRELHIHIWR